MKAPWDDHAPAIRMLHWVTVALVVAAYALAWSLRDGMPPAQADRLVMLHRSVGVTIALLTLVRIGVRARVGVPGLPSDLPSWQRAAARVSEAGLYAALLAQPALGIAASLLSGKLVLFGVPMPVPAAPDLAMARGVMGVHGLVALSLLGLIAVHAGAALQHHFIRGDQILVRMLPGLRQLGEWRRRAGS
jgi:cytochrome b561